MAQDETNKTYKKVMKLQEKGKHQAALKLIDKKLKDDAGVVATTLRAISFAATERAPQAFRMLVQHRTANRARNELQRIGALLPDHELKVRSEPSGAEIILDGTSKGTTPLDLKLKPGFHTVELKKAGFGDNKTEVFIDPDQAGFHSANLDAKTGNLIVAVDQEGIRVKVGSIDQTVGTGKTTLPGVQAGSHTVEFFGADGKKLHTAQVTVPAGGEATVSFDKFGVVKSQFPDGMLQVVPGKDAKKGEKQLKAAQELKLETGQYTILFKRPGHFPLKGKLDVKAGQTQILLSELEPIPDRTQVEIWSIVGVSVSLAMIATATILELSDVAEDGGGSAAKFTLAGVGGAMFVTSGALLKWVRDEKLSPSAKDGDFKVKLGAGFGNGMGLVTATGSF